MNEYQDPPRYSVGNTKRAPFHQNMASASDLQEQGLAFFESAHHSLISPPNSISLIAYDATNNPSWLVSGITQQSLSKNFECYLSPQAPSKAKSSTNVIFVSFTNSKISYSKYFQKYNINNNPNFTFVSYLEMNNKTHPVQNWDKHILQLLKNKPDSIIIIEDLDILLSLVPNLSVSQLLEKLQSIQAVSTLYITSSISSHNNLLPYLLHRASIIISLSPLETGRANDISGILSVSQGPKFESVDGLKINTHEYSYLVTTNNVKLYYK